MRCVVALLMGALALPAPVQAGGICRGRCNQVVHQAAIVQKIYTTPVVYPFAVAVAPQSYYSVGEEYRLKNLIAAAVQDAQYQPQTAAPQVVHQVQQQAPVQQAVQQLRQAVTSGGCQCQTPAPAVDCSKCKCVPAGQPAQPSQPANPSQPNQPAAADADLSSNLLRIFTSEENGKKSCAACHGASEKLSGGLRLVVPQADGSLQLNTALEGPKREKVYRLSSRGLMPPSVLADPQQPNNAHLVPDADLEYLSKWADG